MKDRFGQDVLVCWAEHELEWVDAANTLEITERRAAFHEIAALSGRSYEAVRRFAYSMRERDRRHAKAWVEKKKLAAPTNNSLPPSELRQPTRAQLMGCR